MLSLENQGHIHTFRTVLAEAGVPVYYKRRVFAAEDLNFDGTFTVDFAVAPFAGNDVSLPPRTSYFSDDEYNAFASSDRKPMVVTLHGLSGGSYEIYLRSVLKPLLDAGWEACVVNSRGCAKSNITSGVLYNARATWYAVSLTTLFSVDRGKIGMCGNLSTP